MHSLDGFGRKRFAREKKITGIWGGGVAGKSAAGLQEIALQGVAARNLPARRANIDVAGKSRSTLARLANRAAGLI
jgi:hypothetical protein